MPNELKTIGQVGWSPEQPELAGGIPTHGRGVGGFLPEDTIYSTHVGRKAMS